MDALSPEAKWGLPTQNVLEKTDSGAVAYGDSPAQKLKVSYAPYSQKDEFDRLNEWFDQPRNQELVGKLLEQKSGFTTYAEQGTSRNAASAGDGSIDPFRTAAGKSQSGAKYTDDDLRKQGYSAAEIAQARDYLTRYDAIPEWKKQARRAGNTIGGIADSAAGSAVMTGETAVQSAKNIADTQKNWAKVQQEIKGDERAERLFQLLTDVDMDYNPVYPESRNRDLVLMGYGSEEIREMRDRLAGRSAPPSRRGHGEPRVRRRHMLQRRPRAVATGLRRRRRPVGGKSPVYSSRVRLHRRPAGRGSDALRRARSLTRQSQGATRLRSCPRSSSLEPLCRPLSAVRLLPRRRLNSSRDSPPPKAIRTPISQCSATSCAAVGNWTSATCRLT